MKRKYLVWAPDDGDEGGARAFVAHNPDQAAEAFAQRYWESIDHPDELLVNVRAPRGDTTGWRVMAEKTVTFRAIRYDPPSKKSGGGK